jgi:hypothetical protein
MTKFGAYNPGKSKIAVTEVDADYMVSQGQFVQLYVKSADFKQPDQMVAAFHMDTGCHMQKVS